MKRRYKVLLWVLLVIVVLWGALTVFVESKGPEKSFHIGSTTANHRALIIYDPDPFYNLDEQVCKGFAEGLIQLDWQADVLTVAAAENIREDYDLYVFCANTYNWAPDWALTKYISKLDFLNEREVVALTVGAGSTTSAKKGLEKKLESKGVKLLTSAAFWLMRPNKEEQTGQDNISIALEKAKALGESIALGEEQPST